MLVTNTKWHTEAKGDCAARVGVVPRKAVSKKTTLEYNDEVCAAKQ